MDLTATRLMLLCTVVLGVACTGPYKPCKVAEDCGAGGTCNQALGQCVAAGTVCDPTCAAYKECTQNACVDRYSGITLTAPTDQAVLDGGTVTGDGAAPSRRRQDPERSGSVDAGCVRRHAGHAQ